jgi:molybdenum cofactor guanylyltransferase
MNHSIPKGLILAGGYSTRMGKDKSQICYHNAPQYKYLYDLLTNCCEEVFVSCREEQKNNFGDCPILIDKYPSVGPLGALLTAFEHEATDWFVLACDMPFIDKNCLEYLLNNRKIHIENGEGGTKKNIDLTIFRGENHLFFEPLLGIWEMGAYRPLVNAFGQKQYSLQKVMKNLKINELDVPNTRWLHNINTTQDELMAQSLAQ